MKFRQYNVVKTKAGDSVAIVPLGPNGVHGECILDKADMDRLLAMGISTNWNYNHGAVTTKKNTITIARAIMEAGPKTFIKYLDGNSKNLRRSNLELRKGRKAAKTDVLYVGVNITTK